jgi:hypothetical protein
VGGFNFSRRFFNNKDNISKKIPFLGQFVDIFSVLKIWLSCDISKTIQISTRKVGPVRTIFTVLFSSWQIVFIPTPQCSPVIYEKLLALVGILAKR